jgi:hypothetical protein
MEYTKRGTFITKTILIVVKCGQISIHSGSHLFYLKMSIKIIPIS